MRRAARVDKNHAEVVKALRAIGASVADTSGAGRGFPDLVVGYRGVNHLIEIKDGDKVPSAKQLTRAQIGFAADWRGQWAKVETVDEAIAAVCGKVLVIWEA